MNKKVIVIGGGPAGMLAAISAKENGDDVTLIEKMDRLGRKMSITGKGRCNITSSLEMSKFIENIPGNGRFLYSAFQNFTNEDILQLIDIPTKKERGNRIFPVSDRATDVVEAVKRKLDGVEIILNTAVSEILTERVEVVQDDLKSDNKVNYAKSLDGALGSDRKKESAVKYVERVLAVRTPYEDIRCDKVIIATGGVSYPGTGSTGDGYKIAQKLGHTIVEPKPSLVALVAKPKSQEYCQELQGLTLKNVVIKLFEGNKKIYDDFGEMLFTHFGISGPIVLSASAHLVRSKMREPKTEFDLKPGLTEEKLNDRILRDFEKYKNKELKNALDDLLPQKMIPVVIEMSGIPETKKVNSITKEERQKLVYILKHFTIEIEGFDDIKNAIVTAGGVSTKEINPKTMESKIVNGLFFAGEVIDVDAYTGGFNLQIAYSTGYTAGKDIK